MKQVTLYIPEQTYPEFIEHIKSKFTDIILEESKVGDDNAYDILSLSEISLAEEWLSKEDHRWDELL